MSMQVRDSGTWHLGNHDVARMGYGAMQLQHAVRNKSEATAVLRRAIELGVNHIDTAAFYGDGFVNEVISEVLRDTADVVIATKIGADPNPAGPVPIRPAQRPEQLRDSVEANLVGLGVEQLAIVNLRRLDVAPTLRAEGDQIVDIDDQLATMIALRDEGKIGAIGLSAISLDGLQRAIPAGIACVQNAYSLLSRQYENILNVCVQHGVAWVPFFPLGGAYLPEWPKVAEHPKVISIAERMGITASQVGLAWLLAHKPNILPIPGTANALHLQENIASASVAFDEKTLAELNSISLPTPQSTRGEDE